MGRISLHIPCLALILLLSWVGAAMAEDPLVIVVHGIGGGNRADGWSGEVASAYGTEVKEVTFRYEGREAPDSYVDFGRRAGDWALEVQRQIRDLAQQNPNRRIVVVSHSWGTVVTKLALDGGTAGGNSKELYLNNNEVKPLDLGGAMVDEWVTLGSPLGRGEGARTAGSLNQLQVDVRPGRPRLVKNWTNFYDTNDPVSTHSHNLEGANNIGVTNQAIWLDVFGIRAHTKIWTERQVSRHIWQRIQELAAQPVIRPRPPAGKDPYGRDKDTRASTCFEKHRGRIEEMRAHNQAQNPASGSLYTKTMGIDAECGRTYNACIAEARARAKICPPGTDGTFTQCFNAENRAWIQCAQAEIDCSERVLRRQCEGR